MVAFADVEIFIRRSFFGAFPVLALVVM